MVEEKKGFLAWVKAHRKELIIAGVSITTLIAIILGIRDGEALQALWSKLRTAVAKTPASVRKLPDITLKTPIGSALDTNNISVAEATEVVRHMQHPFDVSAHIRNLHPGWKASAEKIRAAKMLGITLLPGQTIVDGYKKRGLAA